MFDSNKTLISHRKYMTLVVVEGKKMWVYQSVALSNGLKVYVPPAQKSNSEENLGYDEFLFLPLTEKQFKDHNEIYCGFRFMFSSKSAELITTVLDQSDGIGLHKVDYAISRVLYRTHGKGTIIVEAYMNPLFPPEKIEIRSAISDMENGIEEFMDSCLSRYCAYYLKYPI